MLRIGTPAIIVAGLVAALFQPVRSAAGGEGYVVVVNQANALDRHRRADVSKLFLKRTAAWPGGVPAAPCDLSGTSPVRKAFSEKVLGQPVWVIIAYWQQEIASGRSRPPAGCASEEAALQAVRDNPGGIAYVGEGTVIGPGVKVLALVP
jgi:ABC-type phosphate transport system substrate-binding protein